MDAQEPLFDTELPRPTRADAASAAHAPLAERLRPRTLDEVAGQAHLLGAGQAAARGLRVGAAAFDDPVGPAGRGQDHAGAADGRGGGGRLRRAVGRAGRRQGHPRRGRAGPGRAPRRPRHHGLRRRGAPLQQGAAGRLPAACGIGAVHLHRRDHREPVLRGQLGAAVARHGACAEAAAEPRIWPRCCSARRRCCRPCRWPTRRASG